MPMKKGTITLRSMHALADPAIKIDREQYVLRNVSIIEKGPAIGHGFEVDDTMLAQVRDAINSSAKGSKSRLTHPGLTECGGRDGIEVTLGRVRDARIEAGKVRADLHLGRYASKSPNGDLREYLLAIAEEDPELAGVSIAFASGEPATEIVHEARPEAEQIASNDWRVTYGRVDQLVACDVVGDPAANTGGLLSRLPERITKGITPELLRQWASDLEHPEPSANKSREAPRTDGDAPMNKQLREYLESIGLAAAASAEDAIKFWTALTGDNRAKADGLATAPKIEPAQKLEAQPTPPANVADIARKAADEALAEDRQRVKDIYALAKELHLGDDWALARIMDGCSLQQAKDQALKLWKDGHQPVAHVAVGEDRNLSTITPAISDAIRLRAGAVRVEKPHDRAAQFRSLSVVDMARVYFQQLGVPDAQFLSRTRIVELMGPNAFRRAYPALVGLAQSTGDFSNILADTMRKTLRQAYMDAQSTWQIWARRTTNPDFKTITRAALSEAPALVARNEGGEIKYVTLSDSKETYALVEYAGGLCFTRKALINDDMDALGRAPMLQASAAKRKEDDVAYGIITANANMADGYALMGTDHANYTGTGTALSVASLAVGVGAMMIQKGPKSEATLELMPKFLLVPVAKMAIAQQLIASTVDPSKSNNTPNPYSGKFTVVPSARLDANSVTAWYLLADHRDGQIDTAEICFLDDEPEPVAAQETDFDTDDLKLKIRHTVAGKAIDFRGFYKNAGA